MFGPITIDFGEFSIEQELNALSLGLVLVVEVHTEAVYNEYPFVW